jgi:hypothetical protein
VARIERCWRTAGLHDRDRARMCAQDVVRDLASRATVERDRIESDHARQQACEVSASECSAKRREERGFGARQLRDIEDP